MTAGERLRWQVVDARHAGPGTVEQPALFNEPAEREIGRGQFRGLEFLHVRARRIINTVSPRSPVPFRHTINAYRGCSHGCTYCFARPTHEYLGLDMGADFDRVIVVKINAVERLRAELAPSRWPGEHIAMGTNTDPYQRAEGKYHLTRGIVEALGAARNPFSILTKNTLVLRDLDVLQEVAQHTSVEMCFSIATFDEEVWRTSEPGTPHPRKRMEAVARLNEAGIRCGVLVAPILPGLSDRREQLAAVVDAAVDAGAPTISPILLHLRTGGRDHFMGWLGDYRPDLVAAYEQRYRRAYASTDDRERVSTLVRGLVDDARRRQRGARPVTRVSERFERKATV